MRPILSREDFALMFTHEQAVLYFFVEWSVYAVQGRRLMAEVETRLSDSRDMAVSFWIADVSNVDSPAAFIAEWIKQQERTDLKMFEITIAGSGSVIWLEKSAVVDFAIAATRLDVPTLVARTTNVFSSHPI